MLAYLVIREGSKWTDVCRLTPGQSVTIGRAPTNHVVVKDERCSRQHAEVFLSGKQWILRDLESRNGTIIGEDSVEGDRALEIGDVIRIGQAQIKFVRNLATVFPDSSGILTSTGTGSKEVFETFEDDSESVLAPGEPTKITHRTDQTRYLEPSQDDASIPKVGRAAAALCRIAFELAKATDVNELADQALRGLIDETNTDVAALLLVPRDFRGEPSGEDVELVTSLTPADQRYHRVSNFLATTVLRGGEAILARNVMEDSTLASRDSQGEIHATSVLCAPIRDHKNSVGLIHLYCTQTESLPDPDDLEFALAVADTVAVALENLTQRQELAEDLSQIRVETKQLRQRLGVESDLVGSSAAMARINEEISQAAPSRATVLIRGESGVGKELVARAMHYASPRAKKPFVCLNCAALTESLLESELFGHERGAFTGATERKVGKFEAADQGTLMLDEIGEMSPTIQAKFLRVLEGHPFERVGGSESINVDVRVIAATNRDLEKEVAEERFRRDLYFRLHVVEIVVPGLRKHAEDIPELAEFFLQKFNDETGQRIKGFSPEALDAMVRYRWPGNVRELKNVIERAVVLSREDIIKAEDLTLSNLSTAGDTVDTPYLGAQFEPLSLAEVERMHILSTLRATGWNKSRSAQILGIERSTLDRKIRRYELTRDLSAPS